MQDDEFCDCKCKCEWVNLLLRIIEVEVRLFIINVHGYIKVKCTIVGDSAIPEGLMR